MLVFPTSVGRNMQVFRNGTIQILEGVPDDIANTMCREFECQTELKLVTTNDNLQSSAECSTEEEAVCRRFITVTLMYFMMLNFSLLP